MADDEVGKVEVKFGRIQPHKDMGLMCSVAFSYRTETGTHNSVELNVFVEKKDDTIPELKEYREGLCRSGARAVSPLARNSSTTVRRMNRLIPASSHPVT